MGVYINDLSEYDDSIEFSNARLDSNLSSTELLSRPRVSYFLYYPLLLASAALLLWLFPTDRMTAVSSAIGTVVGCLMIWEFLFTENVIRFSSVCSIGLVMGYGFGTLNTWLTLSRAGLPLAVEMGQTVPELAYGVAAALMGCAVLLLLGELFEKPLLTTAQELKVTSGMKRLVLVSAVIIAVALAAGKFHQGGVNTASAHHAGILAEFLQFLLIPTAIMAGVIFLVEQARFDKFLFGAIILFFLLLLVTQGRVNLVSTVLIIIPLARFFGFRWGQLTIGRLLLVGLVIGFLFFGVITYQLLRVAGNGLDNYSISAEYGQVQRWAKEGQAWRIASTSSVQNLERRTLLVTFLSSLLYHAQSEKVALGRDLFLQIEWAIPSAVFPNKPTIAEEDLASRTFHVFYPDQPNSIFTAGALDFGVWGVMIYPIFVVLLCSMVERIAIGYFSYELAVFGACLFLVIFIAPEFQMNEYFVAVRNLIAFGVVLYLSSKLPSFQFGAAHSGAKA